MSKRGVIGTVISFGVAAILAVAVLFMLSNANLFNVTGNAINAPVSPNPGCDPNVRFDGFDYYLSGDLDNDSIPYDVLAGKDRYYWYWNGTKSSDQLGWEFNDFIEELRSRGLPPSLASDEFISNLDYLLKGGDIDRDGNLDKLVLGKGVDAVILEGNNWEKKNLFSEILVLYNYTDFLNPVLDSSVNTTGFDYVFIGIADGPNSQGNLQKDDYFFLRGDTRWHYSSAGKRWLKFDLSDTKCGSSVEPYYVDYSNSFCLDSQINSTLSDKGFDFVVIEDFNGDKVPDEIYGIGKKIWYLNSVPGPKWQWSNYTSLTWCPQEDILPIQFFDTCYWTPELGEEDLPHQWGGKAKVGELANLTNNQGQHYIEDRFLCERNSSGGLHWYFAGNSYDYAPLMDYIVGYNMSEGTKVGRWVVKNVSGNLVWVENSACYWPVYITNEEDYQKAINGQLEGHNTSFEYFGKTEHNNLGNLTKYNFSLPSDRWELENYVEPSLLCYDGRFYMTYDQIPDQNSDNLVNGYVLSEPISFVGNWVSMYREIGNPIWVNYQALSNTPDCNGLFLEINSSFGLSCSDLKFSNKADLNKDGAVDGDDLALFWTKYSNNIGGSAEEWCMNALADEASVCPQCELDEDCSKGEICSDTGRCILPGNCEPISEGKPYVRARDKAQRSDGVIMYCDPETLSYVEALDNGEQCLNNYECYSNFCSGSECVSPSEVVKANTGIIQELICVIKGIFTNETYDSCIAKYKNPGASGSGVGS